MLPFTALLEPFGLVICYPTATLIGRVHQPHAPADANVLPVMTAVRTIALVLSGSTSMAASLHSADLVHQLITKLPNSSRLLLISSYETREAPSDPSHGGLVGLSRVGRLEHTSVRILSAAFAKAPDARALISEITRGCGVLLEEPEITCTAYGQQLTPRVRRQPMTSTRQSTGIATLNGSYTITGGLGGLGLKAAEMLIQRGVSTLLLPSRSGRVAREGQGLDSQLSTLINTNPGAVKLMTSDVSSASEVRILTQYDRGYPLSGYLHAAAPSAAV